MHGTRTTAQTSDHAGRRREGSSAQPVARGWAWAELLVLTTFAMAQPLFALVGANPAFLVAHALSGWKVVAWAIVVIVVPWVVVVALEEACIAVAPAHTRTIRIVARALLVGFGVAGPVTRATGLDGAASLACFVGVTALFAWLAGMALQRVDRLRLALRVGLFVPVAFLAGFLFLSPAAALVTPGETGGGGAAATDVPVVWLVFDQFPSAMLVDAQGEIRHDAFPNFSRLADASTWYPAATTVASSTVIATSSALSGTLATPGTPPVATSFPDNLFTALAASHDVVALENVTQLCPDELCGSAEQVDLGALASDTRTIAVRAVLPDAVADRIVPEIGTRWANFDQEVVEADHDGLQTRFSNDDGARVDEFLAALAPMPAASLRYLHIERPHEALLFLPDGRVYEHCACYALTDEGVWPEEPAMARQRLQRYLLQAMSVDTVLGQVMDELERTDQFDDAMFVVMSDHGVALWPGSPNREVTADTAADTLPVPMFVKYPAGTGAGVRDPRAAQVIDLFPTVLDVVDAPPPADLDGETLAGPATSGPEPIWVIDDGETTQWDTAPDPLESPLVAWIDDEFPDLATPWAFGPNASLYGTGPADRVVGEPTSLVASLTMLPGLADVDVEAREVPAHVIGEMQGTDEPVEVVVALNGTIAGMGTTFLKDSWMISLMVDPAMLVDGANILEVYAVEAGTLRPIEVVDATG